MDEKESLLMKDGGTMTFDELQELVLQFQDQLNSLDYRVTNKNFGSKIYSAKDTIMSKGQLAAGAGDDIAVMDGKDSLWRFWVGKKYADDGTGHPAPFRIDKNGNVYASSITLTGYTTTAQVTTIIGNTITTGYVNALNVKAGSVDCENLTGNTITGKTIKTATSGQRVELWSTMAEYFDIHGTKIVQTYAGDGAFLIKGVLSSPLIILNPAQAGNVVIGNIGGGGTPMFDFDCQSAELNASASINLAGNLSCSTLQGNINWSYVDNSSIPASKLAANSINYSKTYGYTVTTDLRHSSGGVRELTFQNGLLTNFATIS